MSPQISDKHAIERAHSELADAHFSDLSRASLAPSAGERRISRTLSTHWENLVLINFDVEPSLLRPYVPKGTEIDLFGGHAKLSLVGFEFRRSEMCGFTNPRMMDFAEVNLRSYVRDREGTPGVVFIKELCPSRLACLVARFLFNESFQLCETNFRKEQQGENQGFRYEWGSGAHRSYMELKGGREFTAMVPGTEEEFVGGRSFGFSRQRNGETLKFEVKHRPWRIAKAEQVAFEVHPERYYAAELAPVFGSAPTSAFLMDGSGVDVYKHY